MLIVKYNTDELAIKFGESLKEISAQLFNAKLNEFGYRERIRIERLLFLISKLVVQAKLGKNLSGLTMPHIDSIIELRHNENTKVYKLLLRIHATKLAAKKLASSNAYVRVDAVTSFSDNIEQPFITISRSINRIRRDFLEIVTTSSER